MQFLFRHLDPIAQQYVSDLLYLKKLENYQPSHINKNHILNSDVKNKVVKFVLPRGQLALLPGDLVQFSCGLPKVSNDTVSFLSDNAVSMNQQFGPAPPRRITTLKVINPSSSLSLSRFLFLFLMLLLLLLLLFLE